jgi:carbon monoxide dehydrogenase subunit G
MNIENQFEVPLAPAVAWPLLMDVTQTAACFPGTSQIEALGADYYKGRVTVKLGPLTMVFAGNLHIEARDDAALSATVKANWSETRGRGNAVTVTCFALQELDGGTTVTMYSELQLAGQVAQYGRGAGMISAISAQLIADFAHNLRTRIFAEDSGTPPAAAHAAAPISGIRVVAQAVKRQFKR